MSAASLYQIEKIANPDPDRYEVNIRIDPQHAIFLGHFPEMPVLPGVCLLEMLKECVERSTRKKSRMLSASNIKFLLVVDPTINPRLIFNLKIRTAPLGIVVEASSAMENGEVNFKFKGIFE